MKIAGSEVRVAGTGGVLLYEGTAEADREGNIVVAPQGKIELSAEDGERAIHNRGKEVTYYLAWEHEDLSHPSNRYRDAPQQKDYDWMKLGTHVAAGLMVAGGIAALAAGGVLLLGGAAATAAKMAMTVFLAGSLYVGEQALSDIRSGRVSDLDQYTRKAVAGSVVGLLTGASGLLMAEASLWGVLALGFGEGLVGSIVTQKLLNEDGEIDWGVAIAEAGFSAVTAGFAWKGQRGVKGVGGGGEALDNAAKWTSPSKSADILSKPEGVKTKVNYDDPDLDNIRALTRENAGAEILAKNGYNVEQNPFVSGSKNPDYLIEGKVFDCYSPREGTSVRNIASGISKKVNSGQTDRIILNLDDWHGGGGQIDELIRQLNAWPIEGLKEVKVINQYHEVINIYP